MLMYMRIPVSKRKNRRAGHLPVSDEGCNKKSGSDTQSTDDPPRRKIVWTPEKRQQLMACHEAASPGRRGYMSRLKALWCRKYPELSYVSQQQLRNHAEFLRRKETQQPIGDKDNAAHTSTTSPASLTAPPSDTRDLRAQFTAAMSNAADRNQKIHHKERIKAENLSLMDKILAEYLTPEKNLCDINCAVYNAASLLLPQRRTTPNVDRENKRIERISCKITKCRQEASHLQCFVDAIQRQVKFTLKQKKIARKIRATYHTSKLPILLLNKQKIVDKIRSLSLARKRLINKVRWIKENNLFRTNPSRLFKRSAPSTSVTPTIDETQLFWKDLYEQQATLQDSPILEQFRSFCDTRVEDQQDYLPITPEDIRKKLSTFKSFSAPGPDGINSFWWKSFPSTHHHIANIFNEYVLGERPIPSWLTEGRTVLLPKSGDLANPKNYRPITCLNTIYKIFTGVLYERILTSINPVWEDVYEQKGSKRGMAGCKENLFIDRCICQDAVQNLRNLSMAWVDYAKAFDTTCHELIIVLLLALKVNPLIVECIKQLMAKWRTRFVLPGANVIATDLVWYKRGVFQGDSLSPLLFCISLLPLSIALRAGKGYICGPPGHREHKVTHLFYMDDLKLYAANQRELEIALDIVQRYSQAVGMSLGIDKCAVLHIKRGRGAGDDSDMQLIDGNIIKHLRLGETYKFLGIPQRSLHDAAPVKSTLSKEYLSMVRRVWKSQLSGKNKVLATNMLAVPIVSFTFGVLRWNLLELQELDLKTRKILNMNQSLHKKSSSQRLYLPRQLGGRGLLNMESLHHRVVLSTAIRSLTSRDPLLKLACEHEFAGKGAFLFQAARRATDIFGLQDLRPELYKDANVLAAKDHQRIIQTIKKAECDWLMKAHMDKQLHSQFFHLIDKQNLSREWTFAFLRSLNLRSEMESFILACQDGVIHTRAYRKTILRENISSTCRACKQAPETLTHLLSSCSKYAASSYIHRHNAALRVLYYHLRHSYGIDPKPMPAFTPGSIEAIVENSRCKILWNYSIPTPRPLAASKPDIVLMDLKEKVIYVIEFSSPAERNISQKEAEKREKYTDLLNELRQMHPNNRVKLVVLILGSLGGIKASFKREIESIPACKPVAAQLICRMQKAVLLGSLRTLRTHEVTS